jgi:hypothetical protein
MGAQSWCSPANASSDLAALFLPGHVLKQRRFAHPRLAAHYQDSAFSLPHGVDETTEHAQLIPPPDELGGT